MSTNNNVYNSFKDVFSKKSEKIGLETEVKVSAGPLEVKDAIGTPNEEDYPLQKGKEKLMEAVILGSKGQAYTDTYGYFNGTLSDVLKLELKDNFERAVFISTLNALYRQSNEVENTLHCIDNGMKECGKEIASYVKEGFGSPNIWLVGLQPRLLENLSAHFKIRATDRDSDKIGSTVCGVKIEPDLMASEICHWCDLVISTGTIFVNNTYEDIIFCDKPLILYGTTASGPAEVLGIERFCPRSR